MKRLVRINGKIEWVKEIDYLYLKLDTSVQILDRLDRIEKLLSKNSKNSSDYATENSETTCD